jgi:hypothetical protein
LVGDLVLASDFLQAWRSFLRGALITLGVRDGAGADRDQDGVGPDGLLEDGLEAGADQGPLTTRIFTKAGLTMW